MPAQPADHYPDPEPEPRPDAEIVPLRAEHAATPGDLDQAAPPAYLDTTSPEPQRRPIIPAAIQRANIGSTVRYHAGLNWHRARYHGLRAPAYLILVLWHAVRGAGRLTRRLMRWWHWPEGWQLESVAVAAGRAGHQEAMRAHQQGLKTRAARGRIIAAVLIVTAAVLTAAVLLLPWPAWIPIGLVAVVLLARHGRPEGRPIVRAAVVPAGYAAPTPESVSRALAATGIPALAKAVADAGCLPLIAPGVGRDGPGWRLALDLPPGVTVDEVAERRDKLASGLRRPMACVWPEGEQDEHPGRLVLYICDQSLNKVRQPAWPLAGASRASLFSPMPFGFNQRLRPVTLTLMYANLLIGAISRMGKTASMRNVLLAAALDPLAELHVWELKGTGDLDPLAHVAHAFGSGADDETIEGALADLRKVHAELDRRARVIKGLPAAVCPQRKVTPELAARKGLRLHPLVYAVDECQEAFSHPRYKAEFEELCLQLIRRGPALGIMLVLATQRPDARSLPTAITANIAMRYCLKVMDQTSNDMVLGTSAYKRGINATLLAFEDKGIGWAVGITPEPQIIKGYDIDVPQADKIARTARATRELAGLLTGHAAGQDGTEAPRSFAADVLTVFGADAKLYTATIAARLAERLPGVYSDLTTEAVASQLRALGVPVKKLREPGGPAGWGCERTAVEAVTP